MRDRAAHARVDLGVHRLRVEQPLDEPDRRAVCERLQLGDAERRARAAAARARSGSVSLRRPLERGERAVAAAAPSRSRARARRPLARSRVASHASGPQPLALGRGALERPDQLRERAPARPARDVVGVEARRGTSSQNGLGWRGRRRRSPPRARGRAAATAACTPCRRGSGRATTGSGLASRARPSSSRRRSSSRNGDALRALREARPPRARARTRPRRGGCARAGGRATATWPGARRRARTGARSSAPTSSSAESSPPSSRPALELVEEREQRLVGPQVEPRRPRSPAARRARTRPGASTPASSRTAASRRRAPRAGARATAIGWPRSFDDLRLDPLGRPDRRARAAAPRGSRRGRAGGPSTASGRSANRSRRPPPSHAKRSSESSAWPKRGLRRLQRRVERVRDAERAERGLERRAHPVERRADDEDLLRRGAGPRAARAPRRRRARASRACRRPRGTGSRPRPAAPAAARPGRAPARGARARVRVLGVPRRQLLDPPVRRAARDRWPCARARRTPAGPARTGARRSRRPAGERLEQPPLGAGQVLEPVGVDRPAVPGAEIAGEPVGGVARRRSRSQSPSRSSSAR